MLPYTRVGIVGGVMLGLGRALGETMAVTFVIGNAHRIKASLLAPGTTISATLANEFTEAVGRALHLVADRAGLILFVITFIVLAAAKMHADAARGARRKMTLYARRRAPQRGHPDLVASPRPGSASWCCSSFSARCW